MTSRTMRLKSVRRTGRVSGAFRWAVTLALILTSALWVVSYFQSIAYTARVANAPTTTSSGASATISIYRLHRLDSGALIIGYPMLSTAPATLPRWYFGNALRAILPWMPSPYVPAFTSMPVFTTTLITIVIPLWLPFGLFGLPAWLLWRREFHRRRWSGRDYRVMMRERFDPWISRFAAGLAMLITFFLFPPTVAAIEKLTRGWLEPITEKLMREHETAMLALILFCWLILAYASGRIGFRIARWKKCYVDTTLCPHCNYNLTGNVSGRCPECGTPIEGTIPDPG